MQGVERDPLFAGLGGDRVDVCPLGGPCRYVKTGGGAADAESEAPGERVEEGVAASAVATAHRTKVAFEIAALDHRREGGLVDDRGPAAAGVTVVGDVAGDMRGEDQPSDAQCWCQYLAHRAGVDDP